MKPWLRDAERFNCNPISFAQLCRWETLPKATRGRAALQKRFAQNDFVGPREFIVNAAGPSLDLATVILSEQ